MLNFYQFSAFFQLVDKRSKTHEYLNIKKLLDDKKIIGSSKTNFFMLLTIIYQIEQDETEILCL